MEQFKGPSLKTNTDWPRIGGDASLSTFTALAASLTDTGELESLFELAALILSRLTSIDFQCFG